MGLRNTKKSVWHIVSATWELAFVCKLAEAPSHGSAAPSCGVDGFMIPTQVSPGHTDYVLPLCGPGTRGMPSYLLPRCDGDAPYAVHVGGVAVGVLRRGEVACAVL